MTMNGELEGMWKVAVVAAL